MKSKLTYLFLGSLLLMALASFYFKSESQNPNQLPKTLNPQKPIHMLDYHRIFYPDLVKNHNC